MRDELLVALEEVVQVAERAGQELMLVGAWARDIAFGANATRTAPDPYEQEHGYASGTPVPPAGHNWLFNRLTQWWDATYDLLTADLWAFIGAPTFTSGKIRRTRRCAVNVWSRTASGSVTFGLNNAYVAPVGDAAIVLVGYDLSEVLPDGATLVSLDLVYERPGASGESLTFGLDATTPLGVTTVIDELTEADESVVSGDIRTVSMSVDRAVDYSAEFLRIRCAAANGTPAGASFKLMSCLITYDIGSLEGAL